MKQLLAGIGLVALSCSAAWAIELDGGIGYSRLSFSGAAVDMDGAGGFYYKVGLSLAPFSRDERWRVGFDLSHVSYLEERTGEGIGGALGFGFGFGRSGDYSELRLTVPELRLSWRHPLGERLFIEPGVGAAVIRGKYERGVWSHGLFGKGYSPRETRSRTGFGLRPGVRLGFQRDQFSRFRIGVEASHLLGRLDFGNGIGGNIGETRIGGFVSWEF